LTNKSTAIADIGVNNRSVASALADLIDTSQRIQGHGCPCKRRACRDARSSDRSKKVAMKEEHQSGRQRGCKGISPWKKNPPRDLLVKNGTIVFGTDLELEVKILVKLSRRMSQKSQLQWK
jgi:hypothetical protein